MLKGGDLPRVDSSAGCAALVGPCRSWWPQGRNAGGSRFRTGVRATDRVFGRGRRQRTQQPGQDDRHSMGEMRVVLYERRRLVREGMAAFLRSDGAAVEQCSEPRELRDKIRYAPDAVIVGIDGADDALWSVLERCARGL